MHSRRSDPPPAFLDDPTLSVTLADVRASIAFERGTKQHETDTREARQARNTPKPMEKR